jgi:hypothetical protein
MTMPVCPRCKHPTDEAPTICTQCGATVRPESEHQSPFSLAKILLGLVALALLIFLVLLLLQYVNVVGILREHDSASLD